MKKLHKITLILLSLFYSFSIDSHVDAFSIKDLTGIHEDEGEIITFRYFKKDFHLKVTEYMIPGAGIYLLNVGKLMKKADSINNEIKIDAQSAYINQRGEVVGHLTGISLDYRRFLEKVQTFLYTQDEVGGMLPVEFAPPRVTTQQLKLSKERQISSFSTYYNSGNRNRSHNIKLASAAIHHYVVLPGETFSFNHIVGKRTTQRGYKRAPVIVRGELSEGIGGGICQVSSTLFNAADRAGLTIVKRYSHSKQVGYVPEGRDATVSWYGPDFTFRNDYDHPIMIKSYAGHGVNSISIYSSHALEAELRNVPEAPKKLPKETYSGQ